MKINIDGSDYVLDVEKGKRNGTLKPVVFHKIGDRVLIGGDEYILALMPDYTVTSGGKALPVNLINVKSGSFWTSRLIRPMNKRKITPDELEELVGTFFSYSVKSV